MNHNLFDEGNGDRYCDLFEEFAPLMGAALNVQKSEEKGTGMKRIRGGKWDGTGCVFADDTKDNVVNDFDDDTKYDSDYEEEECARSKMKIHFGRDKWGKLIKKCGIGGFICIM